MYIVKGRMWQGLPIVDIAKFRWRWTARLWSWWLRQAGSGYHFWVERAQ